MNPRHLARLVAVLALVLVVAALTSCGGSSDGPTTPEVTDTILGSATVGTSGGIVGSAEISLVVPAGALDGSADITLLRLPDDPTGTGLAPAYRIDGLPVAYSEPLTVVFPGAKAAAERTFLLGEEAFVASLDRVATQFRAVTATLTDSTASVVLPPHTGDPGRQALRRHHQRDPDRGGRAPHPGHRRQPLRDHLSGRRRSAG